MFFFENSFNPKDWNKNPIGSMKTKKWKNWLKRNPFSDYFPWLAYDPDECLYENTDDTIGFIFECPTLPGEQELSEGQVTSLIESMPDQSIVSFHLVSSANIRMYTKAYANCKGDLEKNAIAKRSVDRTVNFLTDGAVRGLPHSLGSVVRDVRLFCSVKISLKDQKKGTADIKEIRMVTKESLRGIFNSTPINCDPETLISLFYEIFNGEEPPETNLWNHRRPISECILRADTQVDMRPDCIKVGKAYWRCLTPKNIATDVSLTQTSKMTGSSVGPEEDAKQIPSHFIFTTVLLKDKKIAGDITNKATYYLKQTKGEDGIIAQTMGEYAQEHVNAFSEVEKGARFLYVIPVLWVHDIDKDKSIRSQRRAEALMKAQGWTPQGESALLPALFIVGLPFGWYNYKGTLDKINRHYICKSEDAASLCPIISDSQGSGVPRELFLTRRNQIFSFDFFDNNAVNRNMVVMGGSGGGKSFTCNGFVFAAKNEGAYIRIMDIGYSYKKQCEMGGGFYIDLGEGEVNLNPFTFVPTGENSEEVDERNHQLEAINSLIALMADSSGKANYNETDFSLIKYAVEFAWEVKSEKAGIDEIYQYLAEFPKWGGEEVQKLCVGDKDLEDDVCIIDFTGRAKNIAFSLNEWTSDGKYGHWFNGPATVDLVHEQVIVLELDKIQRIPGLFKVVSLALMNAMTATLYKMPTDIKKFCLFEELGLVLSEDNPLYMGILNELYRRGRKNNVATCSVFQSPVDLANIGALGRVMTNNSAFHVYLPSDDYREAINSGVLNYRQEHVSFFNGIGDAKPRYMEIGLKTPYGLSIVRVVAEAFTYIRNTTDADETAEIKNLTEKYYQESGDLEAARLRAFDEMADKHADKLEGYRQI